MVIVKLSGGLGNQLFQYAVGRYLAHKHHTTLKIDVTKFQNAVIKHHDYYKLGAFNIKENFASQEDLARVDVNGDSTADDKIKFVKDKGNIAGLFVPEIMDLPDNVYLEGVWQNEKYFSTVANIIAKEFTLKEPLKPTAKLWKKKIIDSKCSVSLHIRHGDYLTPYTRQFHGTIPMSYYINCIDELKKSFTDIKVFVFSDDQNWAKENVKLGVDTEFIEGCDGDFEELCLMSLCNHNIIANSSFSWWGAWLNRNPDKKVFAPNPYFRYLAEGPTPVMNDWIKVPIDYDKAARLDFPPTLSIILFVENDRSTITLCLKSILSQDFKDYEVIVVDSSTDDSELISRQAATNTKVTFLKADRSTNKFTAWNRGLDCARGEFVLLLQGKDFILSHTLKLLEKVWDNYFHRFARNQNGYVNAETYNRIGYDIITSTQILEEDAEGSLKINAFADKKFKTSVDKSFDNLNAVAEVNMDGLQKLALLGNARLNSIISTKFFKRDFLNEHNLRFDDKYTKNAELKFLIGAFLNTEKIAVIPQLFCGQLK